MGRRIRLYLFGFLLGGLIVWFGIMKKRPDDALTSWLPQNRILMQLDTNRVSISDLAGVNMGCEGLHAEDIKNLIKNGDVNFSKSAVHAFPCPVYAIDTKTADGRHIRLLCGACSTETRIIDSWLMSGDRKDSCK